MNTQDFVADEPHEFIRSREASARSAFGVRHVLAPLFVHRRVGPKATRGRVALQKLRETEHKLLSIRLHLRVSWVKSLFQK